MKGTRPLSTDEIIAVSKEFDGTYEIRNRSLFMLGVSVGGRISELLALKVSDVWQNGQPVSDLLFQKNVVKGKETARMIPINQDGRQAISELIDWHTEQYGDLDPKRLLFQSRQGGSISRSQAHLILEEAFNKAGLNGKLATHSMRKSFAQRLWKATKNPDLFSEMMGHKTWAGLNDYVMPPSYEELRENMPKPIIGG
jgi:site-specific recombinase XerD